MASRRKSADIAELDVARGIALRRGCQQFLAGPFGHHDHRVAALLQPLFQVPQEAVKGEGYLRHQAEVDLAVDQGGEGGDKARVTPHQLHQADAVAGPVGLGVGGIDGPVGLGHGGLETEGLLDEGDVIVDGLGDADDAERAAAAARLCGDGAGPLEGAVAADGEEDADPQLLQVVHHLGRVLGAAGGGQDRPPQFADLVHRRRV